MKPNSLASLPEGFRKAGLITKEHAKTFYFSSHLLPKPKKQAAYAVYALCRLSDDSVDKGKAASLPGRLERIRKDIDKAYSSDRLQESLLAAFRETVRRYDIPKDYFADLLKGIETDLTKTRYRDFDELYGYCYNVAGVVGLIMLKIYGYKEKKAEGYAVDLGIAMQLTNILRDIKEDYLRGRIYLPQDEMRRFGVPEETIADQKLEPNLIDLLKFQIKRAREYYQRSALGIALISDGRARLVTGMMKDIYAGILDSIEENGYDVFSQRAHVTIGGKLDITLRTILQRG